MPKVGKCVCGFALALASLTPLGAAPPVADQISVELVNVEVHVTDAQGRAVTDLPRERFRLFEDDRLVEISHFARVGAAAAPSDARPAAAGVTGVRSDGAAARRIAIFVDEAQVGEHSRAPLVAALRKSLSAALGKGDEVSIVRFDGAETELLLPWTDETGKIDRALGELGGFSIRRLGHSVELRSYLDWLRQDVAPGFGRGWAATGCANVGQIVNTYSDLVRRQIEASGAALLRFAQRLAAEPAPRILLHVSDGIPLVAGGEVHQYAIEMCSGKAMGEGVAQAANTNDDPSGEFQSDRYNPRAGVLEQSSYQMAGYWTDLAARINALAITVHPIQAAEAGDRFLPLAEGQSLPASVRAYATENPVDTLALLARETGGVLARAGRGVDAEIARLTASLDGHYSLAFTPDPGSRPGLRRLRVEVDRPGVELRYRRSYRLESRSDRIATQLAALFEAERVDNPLALALRYRAADTDSPGARLQVLVPFSKLQMIPSPDGGDEGRFTVFVTVKEENGRILIPRQRSIVAKRREANALAYTYEVTLPEGEGEIGVAVVDDFSGTIAFVRGETNGKPSTGG